VKQLYFDNPVVRFLIESPETWKDLYDPFIKTFGRRFRPIQSYYLFFEYIGFTKKKLNIPSDSVKGAGPFHMTFLSPLTRGRGLKGAGVCDVRFLRRNRTS
jgi:hypothetical protein